MSDFSPAWLALRERYDREARSRELTLTLAAFLAQRRGSGPLEVLDLGCGTGANLRELAPEFAAHAPRPIPLAEQHWRLVDRDPVLLSRAAAEPLAVPRVTVQRDLAAGLEAGLFAGVQLVAASALLDLVSEAWIAQFARTVTSIYPANRAPALLFTLNYDGQTSWSPTDPRDPIVLDRFNADQRRDKGFGPALGPDGAGAMAAALASRGYRLLQVRTPWQLDPRARAMQSALVEGHRQALAADPAVADWLDSWAARRQELIRSGRSLMTVGHVDLLALPPS